MMTKDKPPTIEKEINHLLTEMAKIEDVTSEKYAKAAESLRILCEARSYKSEKGISRETLLELSVSIFEEIIMLWFEQSGGLITSKVLNRLWHRR